MLSRFADASILIVDDSEANVALLRLLLTRNGLRNLHTFTDPREAVAKIREIRPDLALIDLHMPHHNGLEVMTHLTAFAAGSYLPVLVLTADSSAVAVQGALGAGANDFLTKPFDLTEVILRVRNLLETGALHAELRRHNRWLRAQVEGFQLSQQLELGERRATRDRIARVLAEGTVALVFQPVIDLITDAVVGFEALARFPGDPPRSPDVWFAEAERAGLGVDLELLAVRTALGALASIPSPLFLAVNVSPGTLLGIADELKAVSGLCPRLILEMTEHDPVEDYDALNASLVTLRGHCARLAVDDAGAGYAGFRHLLRLAPDIIKLDISLTRGIDADPARRALPSALVHFARETGALLIAEGLETAAELRTVMGLGVPCAQGFHLGRPLPLGEALAQVRPPAGGPEGDGGR